MRDYEKFIGACVVGYLEDENDPKSFVLMQGFRWLEDGFRFCNKLRKEDIIRKVKQVRWIRTLKDVDNLAEAPIMKSIR